MSQDDEDEEILRKELEGLNDDDVNFVDIGHEF
jgi:hypothetical protein